jgi:hypothetical protein
LSLKIRLGENCTNINNDTNFILDWSRNSSRSGFRKK